jgi:hypothetical protein
MTFFESFCRFPTRGGQRVSELMPHWKSAHSRVSTCTHADAHKHAQPLARNAFFRLKKLKVIFVNSFDVGKLSEEEGKAMASACKRLKKLHLVSVGFDTQTVLISANIIPRLEEFSLGTPSLSI